MSGRDGFLLIDDDLRVGSLQDRLLGLRADRGQVLRQDDPVGPRSDDGTLAPGGRYPASDDSGREFGVPAHRVAEAGGRVLSALRLRSADEDPAGPLAFLDVVLAVDRPAGTTEVPHVATVRLVSDVAVTDAGAADGPVTGRVTQSIPLGVLVDDGSGLRSCRYAVPDRAELDRVRRAMTDPDAGGRLEVHGAASVVRRTWRHIVTKPGPDFVDVVVRHGVDPPVAEQVEVRPFDPDEPGPLDDPDPLVLHRLTARRVRVGPEVLARVGLRQAGLRQAVFVPELALARRFGDEPDGNGALFTGPEDLLSLPFPKPRPKTKPGIPWWRLEQLGGPVAVTVPATWTEVLPFRFDPVAHPGVVPDGTSGGHVLLRAQFDPGGGRLPIVYYQDSAQPTRFSYEPQEFLLPRADTAPHLPAVQIAFVDVLTTGATAADPAQIVYRARLAYRLVPAIDRFARAELERHVRAIEPAAQLHVLFPDAAALHLRLPRDAAGGEVVTEERPPADVTFDDGIVDEVDLSPTELDRVVALLQTGGVLGHVAASLPGSPAAHLPVRLSLRDTTGPILGRAFRGPTAEPGVVRVSVQNRIESPVLVQEMFRSPAGPGASAFPQSPLGLRIPAGGSVDLDYRVVPAGADVADVDPVLGLAVETDLPALLPALLVNRGYASDTFPVTVSCDPAAFGRPGPGGAVVAALRVEFEGDSGARLDAAAPEVTVRVRIPMLARLLKRPDATVYRYRLLTLGAADAVLATSPWTDGEGAGTLPVAPAGT